MSDTTWRLRCLVVAYACRSSDEGLLLDELHVALREDDGSFLLCAIVEPDWDAATARKYLDAFAPHRCSADIIMPSRNGAACQFIHPCLLVDIEADELFARGRGGKPLAKPRLVITEHGYRGCGTGNAISLLHPRCLSLPQTGERDEADIAALRSQLQLAANPPATIDDEPRPATVLQRRVWVKTSKKGRGVRKCLVIQTNKDEQDGFSPYVVFGSDYSPGRASPLKTTVSAAADQATALAQAEAWETANVKQGWAPHDG